MLLCICIFVRNILNDIESAFEIMQQKNYYILLGVSTTASFDELKIAYRVLAKKYHPDKNQGNKAAEEHFKEIQQAYTILSNPEKRKKYDLKLSFGNGYTRQKQSSQYTGSAYQYAQQQSQAQNQNYTTRKTQVPKHDKTEIYQIPVSIGIALLLLYFIISYSTDRETEITSVSNSQLQKEANQEQITKEENSTVSLISDFASPYSSFFGEEIINENSKNNINIHNSTASEAIVCLVENKKTKRTIRNQYMNTGSSFKMNNIPDGEYFLKIYYGTTWDTIKTFLNNKVKGGFLNEIGFVELKFNNTIFKMKQEQTSSSSSFSSYEIGINPSQKKDIKTITAEEFFN